MTRLRIAQLWVATIVLGAGLAALPASASSTETFTGKVSDSCAAPNIARASILPPAFVPV